MVHKFSTMKKIYERWRDVNVTERVEINERADPDAAAVLPVMHSAEGALIAAPAELVAPAARPVLLHAAPVEQTEAGAETGLVQAV